MAKKIGGRRNFGWGRSLSFAVRNAINDRYGNGRFSTRFTTRRRLVSLIVYLTNVGVRDFRDVTRDVLEAYGESLRAEVQADRLSVATAVNYLSAANVLLTHLRGDKSVWISPRRAIGSRSQIRKVVPAGMDASTIDAAAHYLDRQGEGNLAAMLHLCRLLGLRPKEASLLPVAKACRQAKMKGFIEVTRGTKGGRPRSVHVDKPTIDLLTEIAAKFSEGNVIPESWSYIKWNRYCYRTFRKYATELGLDSQFRELRAAFACTQYERVTGTPAPVVAGGRLVDQQTDLKARLQIAETLGHSRPQSAGPYVGTTRRVPE